MLPAVVRRLDDAGVVVAELALRNSSLNEVFLSLTGHPAEEADEPDDETEGARHDHRDRRPPAGAGSRRGSASSRGCGRR